MYPWLLFWAPQLYFPWSGDVTQRISPNTSWFSDLIKPGAGDPEIEAKAFDIASYGKQLGIIAEVLIDMADSSELKSPESRKALAQLKTISAEVSSLKTKVAQERVDKLFADLETLNTKAPAKYAELRSRLENLEAKHSS